MTNESFSFEKAFEKLEHILETMNGGKTPLEESLKLFEEAEKLIRSCSTRLTQAEQKIEMLIKGRSGELVLDADQKPKSEPYGKGAAPSPLQQAAALKPSTPSVKSEQIPYAAAPGAIQINDELPF